MALIKKHIQFSLNLLKIKGLFKCQIPNVKYEPIMQIKLDKYMLKSLLLDADFKIEDVSDEISDDFLTVTMPDEYLKPEQIKRIRDIPLYFDEYYVNVDDKGNCKVLIDFTKNIEVNIEDFTDQKVIDAVTEMQENNLPILKKL